VGYSSMSRQAAAWLEGGGAKTQVKPRN